MLELADKYEVDSLHVGNCGAWNKMSQVASVSQTTTPNIFNVVTVGVYESQLVTSDQLKFRVVFMSNIRR